MTSTDLMTVSSPGKVLICGGYVVLNGSNAYVISTTSRFHSEVQMADPIGENEDFILEVVSPQFACKYYYKVNYDKNLTITSFGDNENPYIHYALLYSLSYLFVLNKDWKNQYFLNPFKVKLLADNDFYSHSSTLRKLNIKPTRESLLNLQPFSSVFNGDEKIAKTGLGSSAALTTSFVASVLGWCLKWTNQNADSLLSIYNPANQNIIHNIAQIAHCHAQGKVGSGFDISAAIYGSHVYSRFDKHIIESVINDVNQSSSDSASLIILENEIGLIKDVVEATWKRTVQHTHLPKGFVMVLCETGKDMNTPLSVRKVLEWTKENRDLSTKLFGELDHWNNEFINTTQKLNSLPQVLDAQRKKYSVYSANQIMTLEEPDDQQVLPLLKSLIRSYREVRKILKVLTNETQTPIEPDAITKILDEMENFPGVLIAGAPGAGGFDALFCILLDESCYQGLESYLLSYKDLNMSPLLTREDKIGIRVEIGKIHQ